MSQSSKHIRNFTIGNEQNIFFRSLKVKVSFVISATKDFDHGAYMITQIQC